MTPTVTLYETRLVFPDGHHLRRGVSLDHDKADGWAEHLRASVSDVLSGRATVTVVPVEHVPVAAVPADLRAQVGAS